jgi:hypothetical protein
MAGTPRQRVCKFLHSLIPPPVHAVGCGFSSFRQSVPPYSTEEEFTSATTGTRLASEQFWGRAVRAPRDSLESRGASYLVQPRAPNSEAPRKPNYGAKILGLFDPQVKRVSRPSFSFHPVNEGSLSADPKRKIVPTTMLYADVTRVNVCRA